MSLKELTWEHHKRAERQDFVKVLMSGEIDPRLYATFLYNQHPMYNLLEVLAMNHGLMNDIGEVRRAPTILEDYNELWEDKENTPELLPVTKDHASFFSFFDITEKIAIVVGLFIYAGVEVIASGMEDGFAERLGVATLGFFFVVGLLLLRRLSKLKALEPTVEDTKLIDG